MIEVTISQNPLVQHKVAYTIHMHRCGCLLDPSHVSSLLHVLVRDAYTMG
jgi:hypothetical protein